MPVPIVPIVGDQRRHRWLAGRLAAHPELELRGLVYEQKRPRPKGETGEQDEVIRRHFDARDKAEARHFGDAPEWEDLGVPLLAVEFGRSNDPEVADWVDARGPEHLALFGSSIIREPLLTSYDRRIVNIHLGLSPYYRGSGTNFWPLVNGEPECVGATIHLAILKVDAGPIIRQARPGMSPDDGSHDIGCKAIAAGAGALGDGLALHAAGKAEPVEQTQGGRLYKNADFHPGAVEEMWRRLEDGMIADYLADKPRRDSAFPIVE
jgi:folate-dependent phosphoribosylglycinamide formyltransferase PurN